MSSENENNNLELFSLLSHEIRTPLNAVVGISDLLQNPQSEESRQEYYKILKTTSENLLELVNNILDYSKINSDSLSVSHAAFNLEEKISSSLYSQKAAAHAKDLDFVMDFDPEIPVVIGDQVKVSQIFVNLVSNAIKFTHEGTISVRVKIKSRLGKQILLCCEVADTGIGIPENQLDKIFKAFHQGEDEINVKYAGTGLGLNISSILVHLLGGEISVHSEENKGSCFSFEIPFKISETKPTRSRNAREDLADLKGKRVLVAEDNKLNTLVLHRFLTTWGMEVVRVSDGREALNAIAADSFDLVLMDIHMPRMNGFEATERIRCMSDSNKSDLPIIALTAAVEEIASKSLLASRFNAVVHKPFNAEELKETIQEVICPDSENISGRAGDDLVYSE